MNWLAPAHWMLAAASLTLAAMHVHVWLRRPSATSHAALATLAMAVAWMAAVEPRMLCAVDPGVYGAALWWFHFPAMLAIAAVVVYFRLHLRAGSRWLAWTAVGSRALLSVANLISNPNVNFRSIDRLEHVTVLGESIALPIGEPSGWMLLSVVSLSSLMFFVAGATLELRRRAGGLPGVGAMVSATLLGWLFSSVTTAAVQDTVSVPPFVTLFFAPVLLAMAIEVSRDHLRSFELATTLRERDAELQDSERRLALAAEAASLGLWVADSHDRRLWLSARARDQLVLPATQTLRIADLVGAIHPQDRAQAAAAIDKALTAPTRFEAEWRVAPGDGGEERWLLLLVSSSASAHDGPLRVTGAMLDTTARKRAEMELLRARDSAEAASRAKSAFLANMSHELRTPLHAVVGYNTLARDRAADPELRQCLEVVDMSCRHLLSVISDVLDLSRIESGRLETQARPFSHRTLVNDLYAMFAAEAARRGLGFDIVGEVEPDRLLGDSDRIRQALLNYLGNALKFTDHGRIELGIEARPLPDGTGIELRYTVRDTGIGIATVDLERLFAPFEQVRDQLMPARGGTGLGLAITRRLAGMMGGDAGARSTPGQGSEFWFTVRVRPAGPEAHRADADAGHAPRAREAIGSLCAGARVMVVDDNAVARRLAGQMLRSVGLQVDEAASGAEALERARASIYELVLMDMSMPALTGLQTTRLLRELPGWQEVPVIAVTGNAFESDRMSCLEAGMTAFASKPIDWPSFWPVLHAQLQERRAGRHVAPTHAQVDASP